MITTLLVDYAGVLTPTRNNFPFVEKFYKDYNLSPQELMKITYTNWEKTSIGKLDSKLFWENMAKLLKTDAKVLRSRIMNTYSLDENVISLLKKLKKQYNLVMVSNQINDWLEEVIEINNLRDIFDYTANSYELGVKKPDPAIFKYALNLAGSKPSEAVFIDDALKNIIAAQELGLKTIHFSDFENFEKELNDVLKSA